MIRGATAIFAATLIAACAGQRTGSVWTYTPPPSHNMPRGLLGGVRAQADLTEAFPIWSVALGAPPASGNRAIATSAGVVAVATKSGIVGVDARSGRLLWKNTRPTVQIVGGERSFYATDDSRLSAVDNGSGKQRWTLTPCDEASTVADVTWLHSMVLVLCKKSATLVAIRRTGTIAFRSALAKNAAGARILFAARGLVIAWAHDQGFQRSIILTVKPTNGVASGSYPNTELFYADDNAAYLLDRECRFCPSGGLGNIIRIDALSGGSKMFILRTPGAANSMIFQAVAANARFAYLLYGGAPHPDLYRYDLRGGTARRLAVGVETAAAGHGTILLSAAANNGISALFILQMQTTSIKRAGAFDLPVAISLPDYNSTTPLQAFTPRKRLALVSGGSLVSLPATCGNVIYFKHKGAFATCLDNSTTAWSLRRLYVP